MRIKVLVVAMFALTTLSAQNIELPPAQTTGGMPLMEALNNRHSTRKFKSNTLPHQQMSNLFWAAWGYNRDDKRTAPSSMNKQEMELYVIMKEGIYKYNAEEHILVLLKRGDYREKAGMQSYVRDAPINIIFVADRSKMMSNELMEQYATASINAGYISENIYLYCASAGLGTVARGSVDKKELTTLLGLKSEQMIILGQTVGYIAK